MVWSAPTPPVHLSSDKAIEIIVKSSLGFASFPMIGPSLIWRCHGNNKKDQRKQEKEAVKEMGWMFGQEGITILCSHLENVSSFLVELSALIVPS